MLHLEMNVIILARLCSPVCTLYNREYVHTTLHIKKETCYKCREQNRFCRS
uniref:Uncharacterized protein n=1 Tax=Anguilla anguilla TaxID=7936 RepID=A0A0E9X1H5_ANGAN